MLGKERSSSSKGNRKKVNEDCVESWSFQYYFRLNLDDLVGTVISSVFLKPENNIEVKDIRKSNLTRSYSVIN